MSPAPEVFPGHEAGAWSPAPHRVVATWPAGHFAENLAVDAAGAVFVSLHSESRIDRYDPATGLVSRFAELPMPVAGLAFGTDGMLWATGGILGEVPGVIWRVGPDGSVAEWARVGDAVFLNGCTIHPDGRTLLVCESMTGRVIAVDLGAPGVWRDWIVSDLLRPSGQLVPGANGIKIRDGAACISVTDSNLIVSAAIGADGAAGDVAVAQRDLRADDMAFGPDGTLYIATHPANSVLALKPDGARVTIAGPAEGAVGATSCAFGRGPGDAGALYVTTTGGAWSPYQGVVQAAKLVRLEVAP